MGPCMCGDPYCGQCFPGANVKVACGCCGWKGQAADLVGDTSEGYESHTGDECPDCGCEVPVPDIGPDEPEGGDDGE